MPPKKKEHASHQISGFFAGTPDAADAPSPFPPAKITAAGPVGALQGRLTLLMGPPGGGKSTLLKLLSGLLQKDSSLKVSCSESLLQTCAARAAMTDLKGLGTVALLHCTCRPARQSSPAALQHCAGPARSQEACAVLPLHGVQLPVLCCLCTVCTALRTGRSLHATLL